MISRYIRGVGIYLSVSLRNEIFTMRKEKVLSFRIWVTYIRLVIGNRFFSPQKAGTIRLFGYVLEYPHRGSLHGMFKEIFIKKNYHIPYTEKPITIVDCGSNIGMAIVFFRLYAPNAHIVAFEPNPYTFSILKRNVEINNLNVELHNVALSNMEGNMTFYTDKNDKSSQGASLTQHLHSKKRDIEEVSVEVRKLSSYISSHVDILKLDIEGAEGVVLEDMCTTGKFANVDVCFIEYHYDGKHTNYALSTLLDSVESVGMVYVICSAFSFPFVMTSYPKYYSYKITAWKKTLL